MIPLTIRQACQQPSLKSFQSVAYHVSSSFESCFDMKISFVAVILCGLLLSVPAADEPEEPELQLINLFAPMLVGTGHFGKTPCMRVLKDPLSPHGNSAHSVDKTMPSRLLQNGLHSQGRVSEQAPSAKDHSFAETWSTQHLVASLLEFLALKDLRVDLKVTLTAWPRVIRIARGQRCHGCRVDV